MYVLWIVQSCVPCVAIWTTNHNVNVWFTWIMIFLSKWWTHFVRFRNEKMSISHLVVLKIKVTLIQHPLNLHRRRLMYSMVIIVHLTQFGASNASAWCHSVGTHHSVQSCPWFTWCSVRCPYSCIVFIGVQIVAGAYVTSVTWTRCFHYVAWKPGIVD